MVMSATISFGNYQVLRRTLTQATMHHSAPRRILYLLLMVLGLHTLHPFVSAEASSVTPPGIILPGPQNCFWFRFWCRWMTNCNKECQRLGYPGGDCVEYWKCPKNSPYHCICYSVTHQTATTSYTQKTTLNDQTMTKDIPYTSEYPTMSKLSTTPANEPETSKIPIGDCHLFIFWCKWVTQCNKQCQRLGYLGGDCMEYRKCPKYAPYHCICYLVKIQTATTPYTQKTSLNYQSESFTTPESENPTTDSKTTSGYPLTKDVQSSSKSLVTPSSSMTTGISDAAEYATTSQLSTTRADEEETSKIPIGDCHLNLSQCISKENCSSKCQSVEGFSNGTCMKTTGCPQNMSYACNCEKTRTSDTGPGTTGDLVTPFYTGATIAANSNLTCYWFRFWCRWVTKCNKECQRLGYTGGDCVKYRMCPEYKPYLCICYKITYRTGSTPYTQETTLYDLTEGFTTPESEDLTGDPKTTSGYPLTNDGHWIPTTRITSGPSKTRYMSGTSEYPATSKLSTTSADGREISKIPIGDCHLNLSQCISKENCGIKCQSIEGFSNGTCMKTTACPQNMSYACNCEKTRTSDTGPGSTGDLVTPFYTGATIAARSNLTCFWFRFWCRWVTQCNKECQRLGYTGGDCVKYRMCPEYKPYLCICYKITYRTASTPYTQETTLYDLTESFTTPESEDVTGDPKTMSGHSLTNDVQLSSSTPVTPGPSKTRDISGTSEYPTTSKLSTTPGDERETSKIPIGDCHLNLSQCISKENCSSKCQSVEGFSNGTCMKTTGCPQNMSYACNCEKTKTSDTDPTTTVDWVTPVYTEATIAARSNLTCYWFRIWCRWVTKCNKECQRLGYTGGDCMKYRMCPEYKPYLCICYKITYRTGSTPYTPETTL